MHPKLPQLMNALIVTPICSASVAIRTRPWVIAAGLAAGRRPNLVIPDVLA